MGLARLARCPGQCDKLMFVGVMSFGQDQKIMFVVVKKFQSNSNQFLVILIWSSELASIYLQ